MSPMSTYDILEAMPALGAWLKAQDIDDIDGSRLMVAMLIYFTYRNYEGDQYDRMEIKILDIMKQGFDHYRKNHVK